MMAIKVYTLPSNTSSRSAIEYFKERNVPIEIKNMHRHPLTFEEFKMMLRLAENGVDDIISSRSKPIQKIGDSINDMTISQLYNLVRQDPRIMRAPILVQDNKQIQIGYNDDELTRFIPREQKQKVFQVTLDKLREEENERLKKNEKIATGHWHE